MNIIVRELIGGVIGLIIGLAIVIPYLLLRKR